MNPIKPVALADQIYTEIKRMILQCELSPGERLVEKSLCESLDVSRTSLREALNRLTQERLVTAKPNVGFSVTALTERSFREICELRRILESNAAALAAERADEFVIGALRGAAIVRTTLEAEDAFLIYCNSNRAFHQLIAEGTGNQMLAESILSVLDKDQQPLFYGIDLEVCTNLEDVNREHLAIAEAIARRDPVEARQLMWEHIGKKEDRILDALKARGLVSGKQ